jgi:hypothetical protein
MPDQPSTRGSAESIVFADSKEAISEILKVIDASQRIRICGHVRPDGDCIGSMAALDYFLKGLGKETQMLFQGTVKDEFLAFLPEGTKIPETFPADFKADLTLSVDTASVGRAFKGLPELAQGPLVVIDHHGDNTRFGDLHWIDGQYALNRPELGLSNWEFGRLFGRGGVLSGDSVFTVRSRVTQSDIALRR